MKTLRRESTMQTASTMNTPEKRTPSKAKGAMEKLICAPGTRVFLQGEPGAVAYIIEQGSVELSHEVGGEQVVICVLGRGQIFGEMALVDNNKRSATARAMTQTTLRVVPRQAFDQYLEKTPSFVRKVLEVTVDRLRAQTLETTARTKIVR